MRACVCVRVRVCMRVWQFRELVGVARRLQANRMNGPIALNCTCYVAGSRGGGGVGNWKPVGVIHAPLGVVRGVYINLYGRKVLSSFEKDNGERRCSLFLHSWSYLTFTDKARGSRGGSIVGKMNRHIVYPDSTPVRWNRSSPCG